MQTNILICKLRQDILVYFLVLSQLISKNYFECYFEADLTTKIEKKSDMLCFCFKKENDTISRSERVIIYQDLAD